MGEPTIKSNLDVYKKLVVSTNGYQVSTNQTNTKDLTVTIQVDYHSLDLTTIPQENQTNGLTKIDYKRDTNSETIKQNMLKQGFTCE